MKKVFITAGLLGMIILYACKHAIVNPATNGGSGVVTPPPPPPPVSGEVCFDEVQQIFTTYCAYSPCHDPVSKNKGYIFNTYENILGTGGIDIKDPEDSKVYKMITHKDTDKRMPKNQPALPADKVALILKWIQQGARKTTNCATNTCDTTKFTYAIIKSTIIDQHCIGCHSGSNPPAGLNYSTYQGLKTVATNGRLLGAISHAAGYTPMPFQQAKLSDCKITQVRKWIQAGAPEN